MVARAQRNGGVEWATLGLFAGFYAAWLVVILGHQSLPWPAEVAALALLGGFYMSLQHEALHGHPTGWRGVNTTLAFAPLSLWLPYLGYRSSHMLHHHTDLTDPQFDPESFYLRPVDWTSAGVVKRTLHPHHPDHGRPPDDRRGAQHRPVPVARVPAPRAPASAAASRWAVHVAAAVVARLVVVRRRRHACLGVPAGLRRDGPVVHPAALVRRALRRGRRHTIRRGQSRPGDVADVPQQQPAPHASRPAVDAVVLPCRRCIGRLESDEVAAGGAGLYRRGYFEVAQAKPSYVRSASPIIHCRREPARSAHAVCDDHRLAGDVPVRTTATRVRPICGTACARGCRSPRRRWTGHSMRWPLAGETICCSVRPAAGR